jgi:hypothetical protein
MDPGLVIAPAPGSSEGWVELARVQSGPFVDKLRSNFDNAICDIVQVPLAGPANEHTEAPDRNIGEVVGVEEKGGKVYAVIDARDAAAADKLGKTLLGASAFMHLDYKDTRTGAKVGPTLLHVAVTNRPYVTGLDPYQEVINDPSIMAATADSNEEIVVLNSPTEEAVPRTLDEILGELREEHGIDVADMQARLTALESGDGGSDDFAGFTAQVTAALRQAQDAGAIKLTASDGQSLTADDIAGAVAELSRNSVTLTSRVVTLERDKAEQEVDRYVELGRIMPKQRDSMLELALTNRAMFENLLPDEPVVKLNNQVGSPPDESGSRDHDIDQEIIRLTTTGETAKIFQPRSNGRRPAASH